MLSATVVSNVSGAPAVVDIPAFFGIPTVVNITSVNVISTNSCVPAVGFL